MENLPIRAPRRNQLARREDNDLLGTLSAFESETAGVLAKTSPRNERVIIHIVALMMALAVGLSAVVKLDRVVSGPGEVTAVGGPLFVSPLNAGVVMSIKVKPGDVVEKGQVLATMDPAIANAALTGAQQKLLSDEALIGRLTAEYNDQRYSPQGDNPFNEVQMTLWLQRQTEYKANVGAFDAQLASAQGLIEQYRQDVDQYRKRYQLAARRQAMVQPLVGKGYVSELQLNTAQDATEELARKAGTAAIQHRRSHPPATCRLRAKVAFRCRYPAGRRPQRP